MANGARKPNKTLVPPAPMATSVRSTWPAIALQAAFWWAVPLGLLLTAVIGGLVFVITDDADGVGLRLLGGVVVVTGGALVGAVVGLPGWRHVRRGARPTADGTGLVVRNFWRTRTVPWDDVLAVGTETSEVNDEGAGALSHTIVLVARPESVEPLVLLESRAVVVACSFLPRPELAAAIRSWAPPDHPVHEQHRAHEKRQARAKRRAREEPL